MKILAFESSTRVGSVALIEDGVMTQYKDSHEQKSHSEVLHRMAHEVVTTAQVSLDEIDSFATGCGPGSFTGIRVALNTAKSLAYAFEKPIIAVDSLSILAEANKSVAADIGVSKILALINAYKNMSYYAIFEISQKGQTKVLQAPSVIQMKEIGRLLSEPHLTVGDGFSTYEKFIPPSILEKMLRHREIEDFPTAKTLGLLATDSLKKGLTLDWNSVAPLYIRSSEAEENKRGIVWSPLDFKE